MSLVNEVRRSFMQVFIIDAPTKRAANDDFVGAQPLRHGDRQVLRSIVNWQISQREQEGSPIARAWYKSGVLQLAIFFFLKVGDEQVSQKVYNLSMITSKVVLSGGFNGNH